MNYSIETIEKVQQGIILPVMEHFYTIQGEGFHSGVACYFIRLSGCDVGCQWCDVKESWHQYNHPCHEQGLRADHKDQSSYHPHYWEFRHCVQRKSINRGTRIQFQAEKYHPERENHLVP